MAITAQRITGQMLTLACAGSKTKWREFELDFGGKDDDASASDSTEDEVVGVNQMLSGRLTGLLGVINNGGTLPKRGDAITDLAAAIGSDSVLPSLTGYTNIKVRTVKYNFGQGPATFEITFRNGVLAN